mmetsp:Transcript_46690/g.73093  ORF Transcript_46690/g.73093 Transcript_46690/m.73093 type:complete len:123 (+) Transcript_46690:460-828(+)
MKRKQRVDFSSQRTQVTQLHSCNTGIPTRMDLNIHSAVCSELNGCDNAQGSLANCFVSGDARVVHCTDIAQSHVSAKSDDMTRLENPVSGMSINAEDSAALLCRQNIGGSSVPPPQALVAAS